jgi:hypothetical protein
MRLRPCRVEGVVEPEVAEEAVGVAVASKE